MGKSNKISFEKGGLTLVIVYILGTGYCGTTVLGLSLGAHSSIIDMGELSYFLDNIKNKHSLENFYSRVSCNCGTNMQDCSYWKDFYEILLNNLDKSFAEKYLIHYEFFKKKYPDKIMVDSSMKLDYFEQIIKVIQKEEIYPILITKDIRNWSISVMKKHGGNVFKRFLGWYFRNIKFSKIKYSHLKIGYEEFALFPEEILVKISDYLNLEFEKNMLEPYKSTSHLVWGNKMSKDSSRKNKIFYDYRWFNSYSVCLAYTLMPFVRKLNNSLVYSNNLISKFNYKK